MRKRNLFLLLALVVVVLTATFLPSILLAADISANTVEEVPYTNSIRTPPQRDGFYAASRYWQFYIDTTNQAYFESATDGSTWEDKTLIGDASNGAAFAAWYEGSDVLHYVRRDVLDLYYRKGTCQSDGTVDWATSEQSLTFHSGVPYDPVVITDSEGYPVVAIMDQAAGDNYVRVTRSSTANGTWTTEWTSILTTASASTTVPAIVPLESRQLYCGWYIQAASQVMNGSLYNGSFWGANETITSSYINNTTASMFSMVAIGNDVHVAFAEYSTFHHHHTVRASNGVWQGEKDIEAVAHGSTSTPILAKCLTDLYCFWLQEGTDHVYYTYYNAGTWDAKTDWIDESTDDFTNARCIQAWYDCGNNYIGVAYQTKTGSPYKVKFAALEVVPPTVYQPLDSTLYPISVN